MQSLGIKYPNINAKLKECEDKIADLKKALEGNDIEDIKNKTKDLEEKAMAFATKIYEEAAKANQAKEENADAKDAKKDDDIKEAKYEEK